MKNRKVDVLLEPAMELVQRIFDRNNGYILEEYESAISAFGGAIIQSGVLPACALYLKSKTNSKIEKARIVAAVISLVKKQLEINDRFYADAEKDIINESFNRKLMEEIIEINTTHSNFKNLLINSTIALKLTIRTFHLKKS